MNNRLTLSYINDLQLHSKIEPYSCISSEFKSNISEKIKKCLMVHHHNRDVIFSSFIAGSNDYVLITKQDDILYWSYVVNTPDNTTTTHFTTPLIDTGDNYKVYYRLDTNLLPEALQTLVQEHNNNTSKTDLFVHRVILALLCDISGLQVHHIVYNPYNENGENERPETVLNVDYLLPCTEDFHQKILHRYIDTCIDKEDITRLSSESVQCQKAFYKYIYGDLHSSLAYKTAQNITDILTSYKEGVPTDNTCQKHNISKPTYFKIIKQLRSLIHWV